MTTLTVSTPLNVAVAFVFNYFTKNVNPNVGFFRVKEYKALRDDLWMDRDTMPAFNSYLPDVLFQDFLTQAVKFFELHSVVDAEIAEGIDVPELLQSECVHTRQRLLASAMTLALIHAANPMQHFSISSYLLSAVLNSSDISSEERETALVSAFKQLFAVAIDNCQIQIGKLLGFFSESEFVALNASLSGSSTKDMAKVFVSETGSKTLVMEYCAQSEDSQVRRLPEANLCYTVELDSLLDDSKTLRDCFGSKEFNQNMKHSIFEVLNLGVPLTMGNCRYVYSQLRQVFELAIKPAGDANIPVAVTKAEDVMDLAYLALQYKESNAMLQHVPPVVAMLR